MRHKAVIRITEEVSANRRTVTLNECFKTTTTEGKSYLPNVYSLPPAPPFSVRPPQLPVPRRDKGLLGVWELHLTGSLEPMEPGDLRRG